MICGIYYQKFGQNIKFFKNLCTKYMASSEAMTSSTRSLAYSQRLVKKCFVKFCETSKCHNFLIFQPIFIRFSVFCSENFTLSSDIKLKLFRSSPLTMHPQYLSNFIIDIKYTVINNNSQKNLNSTNQWNISFLNINLPGL